MTGVVDGRDPSPTTSTYANRMARTDSQEEVEPWDERPPPTNKGPFMACVEEYFEPNEPAELDDGELPSLSLKKPKMGGRMVAGQRTTTRPLSPPSQAGLPSAEEAIESSPETKQRQRQRKFWNQLDSPSRSNLSRSHSEGPDDEMRADVKNRELSRRTDEVEDDATDTLDDVENFCDATLRSLGQICGTPDDSITTTGTVPKRRAVAPLNDVPRKYDQVEEQTAIEVEYIEPKRRAQQKQKEAKEEIVEESTERAIEDPDADNEVEKFNEPANQENWSTSRKNAYLAAMARKAKKDFERKSERSPTRVEVEEPVATTEITMNDDEKKDAEQSDVYSSFNAKEKRKFLKLINSGLSPAQSSRKIMDEREENAIKSSPGRKRFAFWRKSKSENAVSSQKKKSKTKAEKGKTKAGIRTAAPVAAQKPVEDTKASTKAVSEKAASSQENTKRTPERARSMPVVALQKQDASRTEVLIRESPVNNAQVTESEDDEDVPASTTRPKEIYIDTLSEMPIISESNEEDEQQRIADQENHEVDEFAEDIEKSARELKDNNSFDKTEEQVDMTEDHGHATKEYVGMEEDGQDTREPSFTEATIGGAAATGPAVVVAAAAAAVGATLVSPVSTPREYRSQVSERNTPDNEIDEFVMSGYSYYDGDRKGPTDGAKQEAVEDKIVASPPTPVSSKSVKPHSNRLSNRRISPRALGFSVLDDKAQTRTPDTDKRNRSLSNSSRRSRKSMLSPENSRRRILGLPLPGSKANAFTVLDEEGDDGENSIEEEKKSEKPRESIIESNTDGEFEDVTERTANTTTPLLVSHKSQEAAVAETKNEDSLKRLEQNLLRPSVSTAEANAHVQDPTDTERGFDLETPRSLASPLEKGQKVEVENLDVNLSTYLESTSQYEPSVGHDHLSVVSGKSGWTANTGYTGGSSVYTTSSRKRRPGAAKGRLEKAKKAVGKVHTAKGWHESMREAASKNHQTWDPKEGFKGYKDPTEEMQEPKTEEKLRVRLPNTPARSTETADDFVDDQSEPVVVPFPQEWEKERAAMIGSNVASPKPASNSVSRGVNYVSPAAQATPTDVSVDSSGRPKGWVESMKAAAANMGRDAPKWDPERGWVGLDKTSALPKSDAVQMKTDRSQGAVSVDAFIEDEPEHVMNDGEMQPRALEQDLAAVDESQDTHRGLDDVTLASEPQASLVGEKYVQLGDNGSVRSYTKDQSPRDTSTKEVPLSPVVEPVVEPAVDAAVGAAVEPRTGNIAAESLEEALSEDSDFVADTGTENDTAPLLSVRDAFRAPYDARAPAVQVVKEKCDEDDINLFKSSDSPRVSAGEMNDESSRSRRRGPGPVDVDEIDDMNFEGSEEDNEDWAPQAFQEERVAAIRAMRLRDPPTHPMTSRVPPKLEANSKDTSPISERKRSMRSRGVPVDDTVEEGEREYVVEPESTPVVVEPPVPAPSALDAPGTTLRPVGSDQSASSSVRQRAQQWESRQNAQADPAPGLHEGRPTHLASAKQGAQVDWPEENDGEQPQAGTAEWKTFLGKKVKAQSVHSVVRNDQEGRRRTRGAQYVGPVRQHGTLPPVDDDDDSLFEFHSEAGAPVAQETQKPLHESRAIRPDLYRGEPRTGETGYISEVSESFPDISPIQTQEEEEEEEESVVVDERVSETGTDLQQGTFLKRLQACAAPILPRQFTSGESTEHMPMPMAHLAFLRSNPSPSAPTPQTPSSKMIPPSLQGRPDTIAEDDVETDNSNFNSPNSTELSPRKRSKSRSRSTSSDVRSSVSAGSGEFGARTSYLEAIAMKAAVSKPSKRSGSRGRSDRSTASDVSSSSSKRQSAERWRDFLDRKAAGISPAKPRSELTPSEVLASQKVNEMMEAMSTHSATQPEEEENRKQKVDEMIESISNASSSASPPRERRRPRPESRRARLRARAKQKTESAVAAEELAAARVEAMMAAMTSQTLDETAEGEI